MNREKGLPVPRVFHVDESNTCGFPFMAEEFIHGIRPGVWIMAHQADPVKMAHLYQGLAELQAKITSTRFDKIGRLQRSSNGEYGIFEHPGIGGPYTNAYDYYERWARFIEECHAEER